MSMNTMLSWATLTPDLLSAIHEILAENFLEAKAEADLVPRSGWHRRTRDEKTALPPLALKHVALVNKHWHLVANQEMYRNIFIQREQTIQRLVRTVTGNPELLHLVKSVTVNYKYNRLPTQPKARNKAVANRRRTSKLTWQFLHLLRPGRLRHLAVETESLEPIPELDAGTTIPCLKGLTALSLFLGDAVRGAETFNCLVGPWTESAMPTLTALSLVPGFLGWDKAIPTGLKLKSLRIVKPATVTSLGLRHLLCRDTLDYLSLVYPDRLSASPLELRTELLQVAPRLRALHIQAPTSRAQTHAHFVQTLAAMLSSTQSLHVLCLTLDQGALDAIGLASLPVTLRELTITVYPSTRAIFNQVHLTVTGMIDTANGILKEDLPSLSRLSMTSRKRIDRSGTMDRTRFEPSIAAAAAKGISLSFLDVVSNEVYW